MSLFILILHIQVYLVTGGWSNGALSSTETLVAGSFSWTAAGALPVAVGGIRGGNMNNKIFMMGMVTSLFRN